MTRYEGHYLDSQLEINQLVRLISLNKRLPTNGVVLAVFLQSMIYTFANLFVCYNIISTEPLLTCSMASCGCVHMCRGVACSNKQLELVMACNALVVTIISPMPGCSVY